MTVEQFKESITIIDKEYANLLRETYIETFVDTDKDYYKIFVQAKNACIDGDCYVGYLWDCFKKPKRISNFVLSDMLLKKASIFIIWDIHSREKINIEGYKELFGVNRYWLFNKDDVLQMSPPVLIEGLKLLPEDIYIFDDTFEWSLCYTHEFDRKNRDLLILAEPISNTLCFEG